MSQEFRLAMRLNRSSLPVTVGVGPDIKNVNPLLVNRLMSWKKFSFVTSEVHRDASFVPIWTRTFLMD